MAVELYVNSLWTTEEAFNSDAAKPADAVWGTNVFASMAAALNAVDEQTETIKVSSDVIETIAAEEKIVTLSKNLEIVGAGDSVVNVTLNDGGYKQLIFAAADGASDIAVKFSNINITAPKSQVIFGGAEYDAENNVTCSPLTA